MRSITLATALTLACVSTGYAAEINRSDNHLEVVLSDTVTLGFSLVGDHLLGLSTATVNGIATTASDTSFRPYLAQDLLDEPVLTHSLRLQSVMDNEDGVTLVLEVRATSDRAALAHVYTMAPDQAAVADDETLRHLRSTAEAAEASLRALVIANDQRAARAHAALNALAAEPAAADPHQRQVQLVRLGNARRSVDKNIQKAITRRMAENQQVQALRAQIAAYHRARRALAQDTQQLRIHTDYFGQAIPDLPAQTAQADNLHALANLPGEVSGTLTWTFKPESVNIAGWDWQGWSHQITYQGLPESPQFNVLRTHGTWELTGQAVGSTVVAMRYRGLGSVEETFADDGNGGIDRCFTTTEVLPGVVTGTPVISPAVAESISIGDRGYGLQHRLVPWIGAMARGGGANVVDYQYRPEAQYASYPVHQGNLRAVTEAFPGDRHISQRDEEWFALGRAFTSTPFMHLVLTPPQSGDPKGGAARNASFSRWQSLTRWQEVDQHVRDKMAEELGMIQPEPLPAAGYNTDYNWEQRIGWLSRQIESTLGPQGVRMILQHQPGWVNGRDLGRKKDPRFSGGGDCVPYDFTAEGEIAEAWRAVSAACAKWDIDYYAWLSTIAHQAGQFALEVDAHQGGLQESWAEIGNGYWTRSRDLYAFDPANPLFLDAFTTRMADARNELGYQGIWIDSWQKWTTSFSTHADGRPPLARDFWELYARWSHQGVAMMSESTAFPGLSCSVELPNDDFDDEWWFMQHTVKWFRATERPPGAGTSAATDFTFRMYANKATICWNTEGQDDLSEVVPEWSRLAHEYLAALPMMRRSWVLPDGTGVLWLGFDDDSHGVWYPFADSALPSGVTASGVEDGERVTTATKQHVLAVQAEDLLTAFGLQRGTLEDPRIGRTYTPFHGSTPAFLSKE